MLIVAMHMLRFAKLSLSRYYQYKEPLSEDNTATVNMHISIYKEYIYNCTITVYYYAFTTAVTCAYFKLVCLNKFIKSEV